MKFKRSTATFAAAAVIALTGLGLYFSGAPLAQTAADRDTLATQIDAMIADLSCDNDTQCRSFGFGSKPCGGHWRYRLYSTKTVNEGELLALAQHYEKLDEVYNKENQLMSNCSYAMQPETHCVQGQCQIRPYVPRPRF